MDFPERDLYASQLGIGAVYGRGSMGVESFLYMTAVALMLLPYAGSNVVLSTSSSKSRRMEKAKGNEGQAQPLRHTSLTSMEFDLVIEEGWLCKKELA